MAKGRDALPERTNWRAAPTLEVSSMATALTSPQEAAEQATAHLIQKVSPSRNRIGWMTAMSKCAAVRPRREAELTRAA
jgi:hypothetical protein